MTGSWSSFRPISQTTAITLRGSRQGKIRYRQGIPDFHPSPLPYSRDLSSVLWKQLVVSQVYAKNERRIGVVDSGHFDGFRVSLSSAPFCICLVIKNFQKETEDRSPADIGTLEAGGRKDQAPLPWISSSLLRNSVIFKADSSLLCRGRQVFSTACLHATFLRCIYGKYEHLPLEHRVYPQQLINTTNGFSRSVKCWNPFA